MREQTPPVSPDLVEWLKKHYPPRCIGPEEPAWMAHRYAAQVELAQRLIRYGSSMEHREGEIIAETD